MPLCKFTDRSRCPPGGQELQIITSVQFRWCEDNKIAINADKSQLLVTKKRKRNKKIKESAILFNKRIPLTNKADYLGLRINDKLNWKDHIDKIITKTNAAYACLYPIMSNNSKLTLKLKRTLYIMCLRPIMTYACQAWCNITNRQLHRLETLQNKILRRITNSPWYLPNANIRKDLQIETIKCYISKLNATFYKNAQNTNDPGQFNEIIMKERTTDMANLNPICHFLTSDAILSKFYN